MGGQVDPKLMAHHPLGASGAKRWMTCPASVRASEGIFEPASFAAAEGTVAHHVAETCLLHNEEPRDFKGRTYTQDGFEITVDDEMVEGLTWYVHHCRSLDGERLVEQRIYLDPWIEGGFGTSDCIAIHEGVCVVADLKYGRIPVSVEGPQLPIYALGVINTFGMLYDIDTVHLMIIQPRLRKIEERTMRVKDLLQWGEEVLKPAALATYAPDAPFAPGDHCTFCKARHTCVARREAVLAEVFNDDFNEIVADMENPAAMRDPLTFNENELTRVLPMLDQIEAWCKDVRKHATRQLIEGRRVGDWKLIESRTTRSWTDEEAAAEVMKKTRGVKQGDIYVRKLISVAQAEKLLGKEHPALAYAAKPPGKPKLAPGSDPKPAMAVGAVNDFDDMPTDWEE